MIGILGGMGTQAGLDFCNKLAILNRGKIDQEYPLFLLYNKANIPGRPESIGVHTGNLSNRLVNKKSKKKYLSVLKSLFKVVNVDTQPFPNYVKTVPAILINNQVVTGDKVFEYFGKLVESSLGSHKYSGL